MDTLCNLKRSAFKKKLLAGFLLTVSGTATAHDIYIWPSFFTANIEESGHIPVDITASHTTFRPDRAMTSDGLEVYGVDGKRTTAGAFFKGMRRSTFDMPVSVEGTYAVKYRSGPSYGTTYVIGRNEEPKFTRGNKQEADVPRKARDVKTTAYHSLGMAFITNNKPSDAVLQPTGSGFELVPVTHPADYVTGEAITISLMRDGEPVVDQEVMIELEGSNYREEPIEFELTSNNEGLVTFTPEHGGRYMAKVRSERKVKSRLTDVELTRIYYAFEVIHE